MSLIVKLLDSLSEIYASYYYLEQYQQIGWNDHAGVLQLMMLLDPESPVVVYIDSP